MANCPPHDLEPGDMDPCRVLVVDDSDLFLEVACELLGDIPGVVVVGRARSGEEALGIAGILDPGVVLTDLDMPDFCGLELAKELRKRSSPPRVVIMSVHDQPLIRSAAQAAGAAFVPKSQLAERLADLLDRPVSPQ